MNHVVVIQSFHPAGMEMLAAREDIRLTIVEDATPAVLSKAVRDADIIAVRNHPITRDLLEQAKRLSLVAKHGVGVDKIDVAACTARGIPVANTPGANAESVAEQTVALMLATAKALRVNDKAVREGRFSIRESRNTLCISGKKLLLCGFGNIGQTVAQMLAGFKMDVYVYDPFLPNVPSSPCSITRIDDLHAVLPLMDIVSLHLPLSESTKGLFGSREFSLMRPEALLISTARGGIVDEEALYFALKEGRLAGAGLDVFEEEPPNPANPLFSLDTLVASPHNAALSREGAILMATETAGAIIDFLEGRLDPARVVNKVVLGAGTPASSSQAGKEAYHGNG